MNYLLLFAIVPFTMTLFAMREMMIAKDKETRRISLFFFIWHALFSAGCIGLWLLGVQP